MIIYKYIYYKKYRVVTRKFKQIGYWLTDDDDDGKRNWKLQET
jgi:hypothetical protein